MKIQVHHTHDHHYHDSRTEMALRALSHKADVIISLLEGLQGLSPADQTKLNEIHAKISSIIAKIDVEK